MGRRCRPGRRAGRDRGRTVHFRHTSATSLRVHRRRPVTGDRRPSPGLTIPGLANCHSHAFHRALRGRTQRGRGTFWTWREQMYAVAARLDPDSYLALATVTFREMVAAGITCVGEFHYLHHQPDGTPYDDPNAMGHALLEAARAAGLRITLLDTCYLTAGDRPSRRGRAAPVQRRRRRRLGRPGSPTSRATDGCADRRRVSTPSVPCRATSCATSTRPPTAARPPLRAGRGERRSASRRTA